MNFKEIYKDGDLVHAYIPIIIGGILMALGQNLFSIPSGLLAGGVTGLALIGNYTFGINPGVAYFVLNIPMVILAIYKLKLRFTLQSFLSVIAFTLAQMLSARYIGVLNISDPMLNAIFSGVLRGAGAGITYRVGASALGTDVLGVLTKRHFNISISTLNMFLDCIILLASSIMYGFQIALYTIISQFVVAKLADSIMQGIGERKNVMIVTNKYDEITAEIHKMNRGVTLIEAQGGFSKEHKKVVFTVVHNRQIAKIRDIMQRCDENAFMTITDSSEVKGLGFRSLG